MTKTLTEQFLYGQLLDGYYYVNYDGPEIIMDVEKGKCYIDGQLLARAFVGDKIDRIDVLAPVPSYDEYNELVRKSDKLDKIMSDSATNQGDCQQIVIDDLNRQIERLQKQLKKLKQENTIHNNKAKKRRIHINNLKNENNQLREQLKEKNVKLNELRHQRNEANEVIKLITTENRDCYSEATAYLEKWGVK